LLIRYRQNKDDAFRKLALRGADRYLVTNPQSAETILPGALGDIIWLLLDAHAFTGDRTYLARADEIAELAMKTVMDDVSPLPKATSGSSHYEAVTRCDTLMMALLRLWAVKAGKTDGLKLLYTDVGV
jgi:rhamnogalacturonyl hydrolase YesR